MSGAKSGFTLAFAISGTLGLIAMIDPETSILLSILFFGVFAALVGPALGYIFAYVFWAYVISKKPYDMAQSTLGFVFMIVLPMTLMSLSS